MQNLTGGPRSDLTAAQVRDLLTGQDVTRDFGAELLDDANRVTEDLGDDCGLWRVDYSCGNGEEIHGSLSIPLVRELDWGRARVRPYMTLSRDGVSAKFYAGVYVLSVSATSHGRTPIVYQASGKNLLYLLDRQIGETYVVVAGTTYLQALRDLVAAAGLSIPVYLDGTRQATTLPETRVWCIGDERWIDVANDLLAEIAYADLWCDEVGNYRSAPIMPLEERPTEWTFDTADLFTDLVDADYTETLERHGLYNTWRFVRASLPYQPIEGDGLFTYGPPDGTPDDEIRPAPLQSVEAADQAALEAEGLRIVAADQRTERSFAGMVDPLPVAGHRDVVRFVSAGRSFKMQVTSWSLTPYSKGQWVIGGGTGGSSTERRETSAMGTVTQASASGLRVVVDGAQVDNPAVALADDSGTIPTFSVGTRVRLRVRNPLPPIAEGKEA